MLAFCVIWFGIKRAFNFITYCKISRAVVILLLLYPGVILVQNMRC
jgi:hypothetical protein